MKLVEAMESGKPKRATPLKHQPKAPRDYVKGVLAEIERELKRHPARGNQYRVAEALPEDPALAGPVPTTAGVAAAVRSLAAAQERKDQRDSAVRLAATAAALAARLDQERFHAFD